MKISLIMLCYNNWPVTQMALDSLCASLTPAIQRESLEIILVDNGSTDETIVHGPQFGESGPMRHWTTQYLRLPENMGIPIGVNVGLSYCGGDIIGFLNNDLIFPYGWLDALVEALTRDPSLGFAIPYLTYTSIPEQGVEPLYANLDQMPAFARRFMEETRGRNTWVSHVITSCVVFRRDLCDQVGGLDFWFGIGSLDDNDWSLRARCAGFHHAVIGGSFVHHIGSVTYRQAQDSEAVYLNNGGKFLRKMDRIQKPYDRNLHYIPLEFEPHGLRWDARTPPPGIVQNTLLIADWTHPGSVWPKTLLDLVSHPGSGCISLYIPPMYFDVQTVVKTAQGAIQAAGLNWRDGAIRILADDVPPIGFVDFIMGFDAMAEVPGDVVNRGARFIQQDHLSRKECR